MKDTHPKEAPTTSFKTSAQVIGKRLLKWYLTHRESHPWRYESPPADPYRVWLSEIMLQQTTIKAVTPAYIRFLELFPNIQDLSAADEASVRRACAGLGYYRRFSLFHKAAKQLTENQDTVKWPNSYEKWLELPGVGSYTAAAVSSIVLNAPRAVVDGNVERVLSRLLDIRLPPNLPILKPFFQEKAQSMLITSSAGDFNQALMELGQKQCSVSSPDCEKYS